MRANKLAYSMLMLCQNDNVSLRALTSAVTTKRPNGCDTTAWQKLEQLNNPKDDSTKYELVQKFNWLELQQENKNPDEWFAELESIRAQLMIDHSYDIPDTELVSQILYNDQPRIYQTLFTLIKRDLNHNVTIKLEDLKRDIRQIYNQNTNSTLSHGKNKELVLSAVQGRGKTRFKKGFRGDCRICGKEGHQIRTRALPIIGLLLQVNPTNLMIRKRYTVLIVTRMVTPWISVSVKIVMRRKMKNRKIEI
jgi:hypothetical protein